MPLTRRRRRSGAGIVSGGGGGGGATTYLLDTFTRADNAATLGSCESGTAASLVWTYPQGTWGIVTNQATSYSSVAGDVAVADAGVANGSVLGTFNAQIFNSALVFRLSDINNFCFAYWDGTNYLIKKLVAGSPFTLATFAYAGGANGDALKLVLTSTTMQLFINGTSIGTVTDSSFNSATKHGFRIIGGTGLARFDNFSVTS